jgi:hypothetical protein
VLTADRAGRDADGFLNTPTQSFAGSGYALVFDPIELRGATADNTLSALVGDVRVHATGAAEGGGVFVGIGPADAVDGYLGSVEREKVIDFRTDNGVCSRNCPAAHPSHLPPSRRSGPPRRPVPARNSSRGVSPGAAGLPS